MEFQVACCNLIAAGAPLKYAAPHAGITYNAIRQWPRDREPYIGFFEAVEAAKAAHLVGITMRVTLAAKRGSLAADLAILDRRYGEDFGRPHKSEFGKARYGSGDKDPVVSDAELERIVQRGARGGGDDD